MEHNLFYIERVMEGTILIVPKSYLRPETYLSELNTYIQENFRETTHLVFDLILKNGLKNRFFKASISKRNINLMSFEQIEVTRNFETVANSFFSKNMELIERSSLTKPQKFLFKKRLTVAMH